PHVFTAKIQQCVQKKAKYSHSFEKVKKALNMALGLKYENKFINLIDGFINHKKSSIKSTNKENMQVLISDPIVIKHYGCLLNKQIKASLESNVQYNRTNNSALNLPDPNLCIQSTEQSNNATILKVSLKLINVKELYKTNKDFLTKSLIIQTNDNESKCKYIC
ncbi:9342_t:CDS:1, partial [Cetraspora pellucida]